MKKIACAASLVSMLLSWSAQGQSILPVEYTYDANGKLISDANKEITAIHYNLLDLPDTITYSDGRKIVYAYTATGQKIRQQVFRADGAVEKKREYAGQFLYENDLLQTLDHEEGRVVMSGTTPEYQYHLAEAILHEIEAHVNIPQRKGAVIARMRREFPRLSTADIEHAMYGVQYDDEGYPQVRPSTAAYRVW